MSERVYVVTSSLGEISEPIAAFLHEDVARHVKDNTDLADLDSYPLWTADEPPPFKTRYNITAAFQGPISPSNTQARLQLHRSHQVDFDFEGRGFAEDPVITTPFGMQLPLEDWRESMGKGVMFLGQSVVTVSGYDRDQVRLIFFPLLDKFRKDMIKGGILWHDPDRPDAGIQEYGSWPEQQVEEPPELPEPTEEPEPDDA